MPSRSRAGVRLGHADRADLLAGERRLEQALEDVGVAEHVQELGAHQRLHRRAAGERHRAARDLGEREAERREVEPQPADVLRVAHAEEAEIARARRTARADTRAPRRAAAACGAMRSSQKRANVSRICCCSGVSSKSIEGHRSVGDAAAACPHPDPLPASGERVGARCADGRPGHGSLSALGEMGSAARRVQTGAQPQLPLPSGAGEGRGEGGSAQVRGANSWRRRHYSVMP